MQIIFHSHANKTHFHKKGCALGLILKVRVFGTLKWPITSAYFPFFIFEKPCPSGSGSKITGSLIWFFHFQVQLLLDIERSMPMWILKRVQVQGYSEYPNHPKTLKTKVTKRSLFKSGTIVIYKGIKRWLSNHWEKATPTPPLKKRKGPKHCLLPIYCGCFLLWQILEAEGKREEGGGGGGESGNGQRLQTPWTLFPSACFSTPFPLPPFFAPTRQATAGEEEFF